MFTLGIVGAGPFAGQFVKLWNLHPGVGDIYVTDLLPDRRPKGVTRVLVSGDQVLVTVSLIAPDGDRPLQAVLRGRPA